MTTSNTTQGAKLLQEAVKCAQRIREIIDEENFPKDLVWIPTIRAHSSVIHDNLTALEQPTAPASPSPVTEETKGEVPQWMCRAIEEIYTGISFRSFGLDPNSCKREAVQVLLRFALPTPSSSAPAQQVPQWAKDAVQEIAGGAGAPAWQVVELNTILARHYIAPPPLSPINEGGIREAAQTATEAVRQFTPWSVLHETDKKSWPAIRLKMESLIAQAFEGFEKIDLVSANKFLRSLAEKEDAGLSIVGAYGAVTERLHAVQADNAKLREVLEKINRKSSHDLDDDSIYTLSKSALQSSRVAEKQV